MLSRKALVIASLCTIVCTQASNADEAFKSSKFLQYAPDVQRSYVSTTTVAAWLVASQNNKSQAKCIDEWGAANRDSGYQPVLDAMRRFPEDHPTALILAVLQKQCGTFKYVK